METVRVYFEGYIDQRVETKPASGLNTHEEAKRIVSNKMQAERAVVEFKGTDNPSDYE